MLLQGEELQGVLWKSLSSVSMREGLLNGRVPATLLARTWVDCSWCSGRRVSCVCVRVCMCACLFCCRGCGSGDGRTSTAHEDDKVMLPSREPKKCLLSHSP